MSANCSLILLLWWGFDYKQVEEVSLLAVKLVIGLVAETSSQLGSLSIWTILGPGTGKAIWLDWIVLDRNLGDDLSLWWIYLEYHGVFGR